MIMRPIVIFMLIVTHSFTMYTGGSWPLPEGIHEVHAYDEITHIAFSFILKYIYYSTPLPQWTGTYLLPWVGCVITMITSIALAKLTIKSKIGRKIIK